MNGMLLLISKKDIKMEQKIQKIKSSDEKFCTECGEIINIKSEICPKCGVRQMASPNTLSGTASNGKNKIVAALFALFLGGIGAHKFYLGQVVLGIIYLVLCWTFIPALLGFIEFIIFLTMNDETFNRKYGMA